MLAPNRKSSAEQIRSVFISDTHLGSRFSRAAPLLQFLRRQQPEFLYLVGDFIDGWALQRRWYWPPVYTEILKRLETLGETGTCIRYTPGNHDAFLRTFRVDHPLVEIQDEFVHRCVDGRRLLVLHGDQFDEVETHGRWLSKIGSVGYDVMLAADRSLNGALRRLGAPPIPISRFIKQSVKRIVQFLSGLEKRAVAHAAESECSGVICGHIHVPKVAQFDDSLYINLGDWIENCTALVEYGDGRLELLDLEPELIRRQPVPKLLRPVLAPLALWRAMRPPQPEQQSC